MSMSITDLVDFYREQGMDDQAINEQIPRDLDAQRADFIEEYENEPSVQDGWHQQDLIDMRRYER